MANSQDGLAWRSLQLQRWRSRSTAKSHRQVNIFECQPLAIRCDFGPIIQEGKGGLGLPQFSESAFQPAYRPHFGIKQGLSLCFGGSAKQRAGPCGRLFCLVPAAGGSDPAGVRPVRQERTGAAEGQSRAVRGMRRRDAPNSPRGCAKPKSRPLWSAFSFGARRRRLGPRRGSSNSSGTNWRGRRPVRQQPDAAQGRAAQSPWERQMTKPRIAGRRCLIPTSAGSGTGAGLPGRRDRTGAAERQPRRSARESAP